MFYSFSVFQRFSLLLCHNFKVFLDLWHKNISINYSILYTKIPAFPSIGRNGRVFFIILLTRKPIATIRIRQQETNLKQFCIRDLVPAIYAISIILQARTIRFPVAILLPEEL